MVFILNLLLLSVAIFIIAKIMPSIYIKSFWTAIVVALVYSIINFLTGWFLVLLALPFMIITFGLFKPRFCSRHRSEATQTEAKRAVGAI